MAPWIRAACSEHLTLVLDGCHLDGAPVAVEVGFCVGVPGLKQPCCAAAPPGRPAGGEAFAVESEVALEVRQQACRWSGRAGRMPTSGPRSRSRRIAAEQAQPAVAVAVLHDPENRRGRGRGGPHRAVLTPEEPAGLIRRDRRRSQHLAAQALVRAGEQPLVRWQDRIDRADRDPDPNSSQSSSLISRREIRLRAVNATPPRPPTPARTPTRRPVPSVARSVARTPGKRNRCVRCSVVHDRGWRKLSNLMGPRPHDANLLAIGDYSLPHPEHPSG